MSESELNYKDGCCVLGSELTQYRAPSRTITPAGLAGAYIAPGANVVVNNLAIGESESQVLQFTGPKGDPIEIQYTLTNRAGRNHAHTTSANGSFAHNNAGQYLVEMRVLTCGHDGQPVPVNIGVLASSFQTSNERWWVDGTFAQGQGLSLTPVDTLIWTTNQIIAVPTTGLLTTAINNQAAFLIGYENVTEVTAVWQQQANVGSTTRISLYGGPDKAKVDLCDAVENLGEINKQLASAGSDTDISVVAASLAGSILTVEVTENGTTQSDTVDLSAFLDDTDDQAISQFQITGGNVVLEIEGGNTVAISLADFQDGTGTDDQTISLLNNILTLEDGGTVDLSAYLDNTDEQTLSTTEVNGVTTEISISNGNTVAINHPAIADTVLKTIEIERSYLVATDVNDQDVNDNGTVLVTEVRADTGWEVQGSGLSYAGTPDRVRINANIHQRIADAANIQRAAPQVQLLRNGVVIATSSSGYIRDANDHEDSSNTIVFTDPDPGLDPIYTLVSVQESTTGGVVTSVIGSFSGEAVVIEKCQVYAPPAAGGGDAAPTLPAAGGKLVSDNFQDQFGSFNLQVRNTTNAPINWEALVAGVPYSAIDDLNLPASVTAVREDNGNGTFDFLFSGGPLDQFDNVTITGDGPTPAGDGTGLSLFCETD